MLRRERDAVQTIMERKIRVLVQSISGAIDTITRESSHFVAAGAPMQALSKVFAINCSPSIRLNSLLNRMCTHSKN
jgi:hypothetical protein